ncbi:hypothetical protein ACRQ5D_30890 [Mucilaginibacter sp. P25]|uniref:hypothetical protein n=1 Tax=Mucilaginibacter sp. P25 TaxID=3423945 RepID=UPI003D7B8B21
MELEPKYNKQITARMKKLIFYFLLISAPFCASAQSKKNTAQVSDRKLWLSYMDKVARPVISNLAADQLKEKCQWNYLTE